MTKAGSNGGGFDLELGRPPRQNVDIGVERAEVPGRGRIIRLTSCTASTSR